MPWSSVIISSPESEAGWVATPVPALSHRLRSSLVRMRDQWMFSDNLPGKRHRWPVRDSSVTGKRSPFFVLGHPRSGTTLLRALLSRHPDVFIPPENGALWRMIRVFGDVRSADWDKAVDRVIGEFEKGYEFDAWGVHPGELRARIEKMPPAQRSLETLIRTVYQSYGERFARGKSIWGDKTTPGSFDHIYKLALVFPKASYVHIIRDGRDCVVSAMNAGFFNNDIKTAAHAWRDNIRQCRRFGNTGDRQRAYLEVRYESLVSNRAPVLADICGLLEIALDEAMLNNEHDVSARLPDVEKLQHHRNVSRPVFDNSVGKWQKELSAQECRDIEQIMGAELERCGYQLASN